MLPRYNHVGFWAGLAALAMIVAPAQKSCGQEPPLPGKAETVEEDFVGTGSSGTLGVGGTYIDSAVPENVFRLRFDGAFGENRANRAEFLYGQYSGTLGATGRPDSYVFDGKVFRESNSPNAPPLYTTNSQLAKSNPSLYQFVYAGRGLPEVETNINALAVSAYGEYAIRPWLSAFLEIPLVSMFPDVNSGATGLGDINFGFKYAFLLESDRVASFQMRIYLPTGNSYEGLGTGHVSLEPALLAQRRFGERWTLFAELRDWIPTGADDTAGNVLRYGLGASCVVHETSTWWAAPFVECVGWTVLSGLETVAISPDVFDIRDARGETIINGKIGLRLGFFDHSQFAVSYSRGLTGDVWYRDFVRLEWKRSF